ncbi:hypothetical protein NDU88_000784 [Pleurodeles waltl]|uniref:Uncharacterized protein n=1 Tax=Pleurodeles waltl TaxID=8319 RepID=A0AAV7VX14_PLEWA|nr:hypothetical protein NDU88_000784 [Pleurodeles waltl]
MCIRERPRCGCAGGGGSAKSQGGQDIRCAYVGEALRYEGKTKTSLLPSETTQERGEAPLEERALRVASKMAPPTELHQDTIINMSDEEEEWQMAAGGPNSKFQLSEQPLMVQEGRMLKVIPRIGKSMLDMRGMLYGETDVGGQAGMAQVRLEFWQPGANVPQSGLGSAHTQGVHEEQASSLRLGLSAGNQKVTVGVRAPLGHRLKERVRSGATHLTLRAPIGSDFQTILEEPSTSQGADFIEENCVLQEGGLDYEEDEPEEGEIGQHREERKDYDKKTGSESWCFSGNY